MEKLNIRKFGLAFGGTGAILYVCCGLTMLLLGHDGTIWFFNVLLHGFDVSSVIRMDIPLMERILGTFFTYILGWLTGASIAAIYNVAMKKS